MSWVCGNKEPSCSGEYVVIAKSMKGKILEEIVDFCIEDGWQIGNNWNILVWKDSIIGD